jgi:hypothetical protein
MLACRQHRGSLSHAQSCCNECIYDTKTCIVTVATFPSAGAAWGMFASSCSNILCYFYCMHDLRHFKSESRQVYISSRQLAY